MTEVIDVPRLLQIGSTGRNSGKTTLAKQLIENYQGQYPVVALKIITITGKKGVCQRGTAGCGICTSIDAGYELVEEKNLLGNKDTMQLLRAGADRVFLLKAFEDSLQTGFQKFLTMISENAMIICESNSLRKYVKPALFLMMDNHKKRVKPTAQSVYDAADEYLISAKLNNIMIENQTWKLAHAQCI